VPKLAKDRALPEGRLAVACDKVYQFLAHSRWFSPGTLASSFTKTGRHDIAEIFLKVALKHQKLIKVFKVIYRLFGPVAKYWATGLVNTLKD
jgi:hypothetical protein